MPRYALHALFRSARPPFLLLTPVIVFLAFAVVQQEVGNVSWQSLSLVLLSAVMAALSSNWLNEYFDAVSGLDHETQITPFSGGSKALIEHPQYRELVKWAGLLSLSISVWSGLALVAMVGWHLLLVGLLGVALVVSYTPVINRYPMLCLFAPGLGYGLVIYLGSYWALGGNTWGEGWLWLPVPMLLVSGLLLLNQFPDKDADLKAGRRHAVIAWGGVASIRVFQALHLLTIAWLLFVYVVGWMDDDIRWILLFLLAEGLLVNYAKPFSRGEIVLPVMALNVAVTLLLPLSLGVALLLS